MDLAMLSRGQVTRTTPELAQPSKLTPHANGGTLSFDRDYSPGDDIMRARPMNEGAIIASFQKPALQLNSILCGEIYRSFWRI
ncbi:hypothetical protein TNCV_3797311 [Trichonephila clavipes]|nr:hypothetical protein TNCV_3797311 [Trichonephila clavipes]